MIRGWLMTLIICAAGLAHAETPPSPQVLGETLWLAREAAVLANSTPASAAAKLPTLLKQHFNVVVTCGKGQLLDPSAPRCLLGARRIARAFYRGQLRAMTPEVAEVVRVNITDESYAHVSTTDAEVRVDLPYTLPTEKIVAQVERAVKSRPVVDRIKTLAAFKQSLADWDELGLIELDFDPRLRLTDKLQALRTLTDLAAEDQTLFDRPAEILYVSNYFAALFERRLRMEEAIKATASADEARSFLKRAKADEAAVRNVQARIDALRERIRVAGERLQDQWKVKYDCSDQSWLSLGDCARTLERLTRISARAGGFEVDVKMVLVVAPTDLTEDFDVFQSVQDKEPYGILAIRSGFDPRQLKLLAQSRGWIR